MPDLSVGDITQQYSNCVILYKGKICKVKQIGEKIKLLDLRTQRNSFVDFSLKDFSPPQLRLGYVNLDSCSIYVSRKPVRMFMVGINSANCTALINKKAPYPVDPFTIQEKVLQMECPEFADMMLGHYPSLKKAYKQAREQSGNVAFDKQFAVDYYSTVFYKGMNVGTYGHKEEKIHFNPGFEHLSCLIGNEYEKATRTFEEATA